MASADDDRPDVRYRQLAQQMLGHASEHARTIHKASPWPKIEKTTALYRTKRWLPGLQKCQGPSSKHQ